MRFHDEKGQPPSSRSPRRAAFPRCSPAVPCSRRWGRLAAGGSGQAAAAGPILRREGDQLHRTSDHAIVNCYRAHGEPSFPVPVYDPVTAGDSRPPLGKLRLHPPGVPDMVPQATPRRRPAGAEFKSRSGWPSAFGPPGVKNWPDPSPDGRVPAAASLSAEKPRLHARLETACQRFGQWRNQCTRGKLTTRPAPQGHTGKSPWWHRGDGGSYPRLAEGCPVLAEAG